MLPGHLQGRFHQLFCLRAGDEGAGICAEFAAVKLCAAQQVLQGLTQAATAQQLAQRCQFLFRQRVIKMQVEPGFVAPQHMHHETLHGMPGALHPAGFQIRSAAAEHFLYGFHSHVT